MFNITGYNREIMMHAITAIKTSSMPIDVPALINFCLMLAAHNAQLQSIPNQLLY